MCSVINLLILPKDYMSVRFKGGCVFAVIMESVNTDHEANRTANLLWDFINTFSIIYACNAAHLRKAGGGL